MSDSGVTRPTAFVVAGVCSHGLLQYTDMPAWFRQMNGPGMISGYRPAERPPTFYFGTLCTLHNEFVNVWSHLIGAFACIGLAFDDHVGDGYVLAYRLASSGCFATSAVFHLFMPYSERACAILLRLDYAAIFILIGVSCIPFYTIEYNCHARLQNAAIWTTSVMMLALATAIATQKWFSQDTPRGRAIRVLAFSMFAMTCVVFGGLSIFVGFSPRPYLEADATIGLSLNLSMAFYLAGPVVYALGWPERKWPGTFDMFGASHQLMHICVLVAAMQWGGALSERVYYVLSLSHAAASDTHTQ
eukprot:CAMPEP_0183338642 /NCGR_PEP_ID=MMETSP0164_2-20130417/5862_1 /TAXON_ID=221442 /ORGANISM="Coccolithus pelagicus ssp braarudi, Strain PLY182g" /LENGTH=301 /DNA_ID=CAMNT_0025508521 /DNA_START=84 /DNA_END=990 /DNA_ORIENTATION=+